MEKFRYVKPDQIMDKDHEMIRYLDIDGNLLTSTVFGELDEKKDIRLSADQIKKVYEFMVLSRQQDVYMTQLQRQGRMLTFAPNFGEEGSPSCFRNGANKRRLICSCFPFKCNNVISWCSNDKSNAILKRKWKRKRNSWRC